jgi:phosphatidylserine decarboxylase
MPGELLDNQGRGAASWHWPAIHPEARKFAAVAAVACVAAALLVGQWLAWPLGILVYCICAFFRDPLRVTPKGDGLIVAPADGLITLIQKVPPPRELSMDDGTGSPRWARRR